MSILVVGHVRRPSTTFDGCRFLNLGNQEYGFVNEFGLFVCQIIVYQGRCKIKRVSRSDDIIIVVMSEHIGMQSGPKADKDETLFWLLFYRSRSAILVGEM